jgi:phage FluMu protein Com
MAIEFRCANCGKLLRVGENAAGRNAQCPDCGGLTSVPAASEATPPSAQGMGGQSPPPPPGSPFGTGSESPFGGPSGPGGSAPWASAGAQNPYQSPMQAGQELLPAAADPFVVERVQGPAIALMVLGCIGVVLQILGLLGNLLSIGMMHQGAMRQGPAQPLEMMFSGGVGIVTAIFSLVVSAVIVIGGLKMKSLESYAFAMAAAIIAVIPCVSPCCVVSLPFGIWALVVLNDEAVKAAFRQ